MGRFQNGVSEFSMGYFLLFRLAMYHGRAQKIQSRREQIKEKAMRERRRLNRQQSADQLLYGVESLS